MPGYHLAQLNVGIATAPLDSDVMADFMNNLDRINALAESSPGFIWRLKADDGNATSLRPIDDRTLVNMSVWTDAQSLSSFVFRSPPRRVHAQAPRMVRTHARGLSRPVVGTRGPHPDDRRGRGASRAPPRARRNAACLRLQARVPATRCAAGEHARGHRRRLPRDVACTACRGRASSGFACAALRVPMAHPHRTAGGVVSESPLVLTDVFTDDGVVGHSIVFTYTTAALKPDRRADPEPGSARAGRAAGPGRDRAEALPAVPAARHAGARRHRAGRDRHGPLGRPGARPRHLARARCSAGSRGRSRPTVRSATTGREAPPGRGGMGRSAGSRA